MLQPDKKTAIVHGHRRAYREIARVIRSSSPTATPRRPTYGATSCHTWKGSAG